MSSETLMLKKVSFTDIINYTLDTFPNSIKIFPKALDKHIFKVVYSSNKFYFLLKEVDVFVGYVKKGKIWKKKSAVVFNGFIQDRDYSILTYQQLIQKENE